MILEHLRVDCHEVLFIQAQLFVLDDVEIIEHFISFRNEVRVLKMCAIVSDHVSVASDNAILDSVFQWRIFNIS